MGLACQAAGGGKPRRTGLLQCCPVTAVQRAECIDATVLLPCHWCRLTETACKRCTQDKSLVVPCQFVPADYTRCVGSHVACRCPPSSAGRAVKKPTFQNCVPCSTRPCLWLLVCMAMMQMEICLLHYRSWKSLIGDFVPCLLSTSAVASVVRAHASKCQLGAETTKDQASRSVQLPSSLP